MNNLPSDIIKLIFEYVDQEDLIAVLLTSSRFYLLSPAGPFTTITKIVKKYGLVHYNSLGLAPTKLYLFYKSVKDHITINEYPKHLSKRLAGALIAENKSVRKIMNYHMSINYYKYICSKLYTMQRTGDLAYLRKNMRSYNILTDTMLTNAFSLGVLDGFVHTVATAKNHTKNSAKLLRKLLSTANIYVNIDIVKLIYKVEEDIVTAAKWYDEFVIFNNYAYIDDYHSTSDDNADKCDSIIGILAGLCFIDGRIDEYNKLKTPSNANNILRICGIDVDIDANNVDAALAHFEKYMHINPIKTEMEISTIFGNGAIYDYPNINTLKSIKKVTPEIIPYLQDLEWNYICKIIKAKNIPVLKYLITIDNTQKIITKYIKIWGKCSLPQLLHD